MVTSGLTTHLQGLDNDVQMYERDGTPIFVKVIS